MSEKKKRNRRTHDEMIAALEAKISAVKARAARKQIRAHEQLGPQWPHAPLRPSNGSAA